MKRFAERKRRLAGDENAELASRLGRLLDEAKPGWRDSPEGRWLNAVERKS